MREDKKELKGLGGWLILVGIGVVLMPVVIAKDLLTILSFFQNDWEVLIDPDSGVYYPELFYFICAEAVVGLLLLIAAIYAFYLFFSKHYRFPKFYIWLISIFFLVLLSDTVITNILFPEEDAFQGEEIKELVKGFLRMCIWIPYLLLSVRVENTFVEKRKI